MKERITFSDIFITALIFSLSVLISFHLLKENRNDYLEINCPEGTFIYPLNENATYEINGKIGKSIIEVKDKTVCFIESPCPNKTCISDGCISNAGEFLACLPNCISVTITGKGGVDDVSF